MRHSMLRNALATGILFALAATPVRSEEPDASPPGLPAGFDWTFSFDASVGAFGFGNSLYRNPRPEQPSGDLSDNWYEGSIKPALGAEYTADDSSQFYGMVSAVGAGTYGDAPSLVGDDSSSFDVEDLYVGWRSGDSLDLGENVLDITIGRSPYTVGNGLLLYDGAADGGSRGGYWTNARKAFEFAAIGRFKPGEHTLEAFYLDKEDLPEADSDSTLWGVNYEYTIGESTTLGATYMKWSADPEEAPQRDGLDVYNLRVYTTPFPGLEALSFELEYVKEDNGDALDATGWSALSAWQFDGAWQPRLSYRYAFFEGDDPATGRNEAFDGLLTGFHDWGTWWQGEIAGGYFIPNSNLISHQMRLHMDPNEAISTGLILYDFLLDHPSSLDPSVTSDEVAYELDWYLDWAVNDNVNLSFVAAVAEPGDAVEQLTGRTDTFLYGMVFAAYSF